MIQFENGFFEADWNEVYEFIEFTADNQGKVFRMICNHYLKRELSAYRFVDEVLVEINSEEEIIEIEKAINSADKFTPVKNHLSSALHLLSEKKNQIIEIQLRSQYLPLNLFAKF